MRIDDLIRVHLEQYAEMQIADVYKLLHQATFGSSHAISRKQSTREWLEHELSINPPAAEEPLLESISLDGSLVRLHLRPYKAGGGVVEPLLEAIIRSKNTWQGGMADDMAAHWAAFEAMMGETPFDPQEVRLFGRVYAARNWAVMQHSPQFIRAHHPAYRVLTLDDARQVCERQGILVG